MSDTPFISSAGIVALHTIAKILAGMRPGEDESGWESFREIDRSRQAGEKVANFKLLGPQPRVMGVLDTVGFSQYFEIFTHYDTALESFH
jgi:anti-anti-sigma regulatory factor